ncbi:BatD family protein [Myroides sp. LJL119]
MKNKHLNTLFCLLFFTCTTFGQSALETVVDTTQIKIGDSFSLTLRAHGKQTDQIIFPEQEHFGEFDVLETYPTDTILSQGLMELIKKYELTQFDPGDYKLPQLPVVIDKKLFQSDSLQIHVLDVQVDTLKTPLYPIKNISTKGASFSTYWYYVFFVILSLVIGIAIYFYIKHLQNKYLTEEDKYKTPFEKASKKLKRLEQKKNWTKQGAKPYYSDMSNIVRSFLEDTFDISAHELTTFETLTLLKLTLKNKNIKLDPAVITEFKHILEASDLVKFAKSQPTDQQILADTLKMQKIVSDINIAYPISAANQTMRIRLREQRKRKRMRIRVLVPIAVSGLLLIFTGIAYIINTKAERDYNFFTFNSTQILLDNQWITSTYGVNPGLTISTPEVLVHKNDPTLQDSSLEGIQYLEQFRFNDLEDDIFIIVNNLTLDKDKKNGQNDIIKQFTALLTQNYHIKNLEQKESAFENANGVKGTKIDGTFSFEDAGKQQEKQVAFQAVFTQFGNNCDQAWIFYKDSDKLAPELAQRVFESILYKQVNKQ